jgi:predicted transcriptional regulator
MNEMLFELGLTKTQVEVYLCILSYGRIMPALVAKITGIKRPTVYGAVVELEKMGIVSEDRAGKSKYFVATILDFENFVKIKKEELARLEALSTHLLVDLKKVARTSKSSQPEITYVSEVDIKDFLYRQTDAWNKSMLEIGETSWWGHNSLDFTKHKFVQDWIDWYWEYSPKIIGLNLFSTFHEGEDKIAKKSHKRRVIKFWKTQQDSSVKICGDYILMFITNQKPQYVIQIKDRLMAESLRRTYRELWGKF